MFVTKGKYNRDIAAKNAKIHELETLVDQLTEKQREVAERKAEKVLENEISLENTTLEYEETPVNPILSDKKTLNMPPRSEYNERLEKAIKLFQENHPRSEVERIIGVSRKTARKYLQIAIRKRKVKKADYEALNK